MESQPPRPSGRKRHGQKLMAENPYKPPATAEPEVEPATPIVGRTFIGKLATPTFTLICLDYAWIAYEQLREQKYARVLQAFSLIAMFAYIAWLCRVAYHRKPRP